MIIQLLQISRFNIEVMNRIEVMIDHNPTNKRGAAYAEKNPFTSVELFRVKFLPVT